VKTKQFVRGKTPSPPYHPKEYTDTRLNIVAVEFEKSLYSARRIKNPLGKRHLVLLTAQTIIYDVQQLIL
jgi:hypothetical protein